MSQAPVPTIIEALSDQNLFAPHFRGLDTTWRPWIGFLKVLFGLPLTEDELTLYRECTGRMDPRPGGYTEAWLIIGRRGGKSRILALIAVYLAAFRDFRAYLSPGERGTIMIIATDRRQARVIHRYCRALIKQTGLLAGLVERETDTTLDLSSGVSIEVQAGSWRGTRGYTLVAALCDELAFWRSDETAANPDSEILAAIRPSMATVPGAVLLCASSPYARRGELWNAYRRCFGVEDAPALVWQRDTAGMNPSVPTSIIRAAYEADPQAAGAEYGAEFRSDLEAFLSQEAISAVVARGRRENRPAGDVNYYAAVDPSGGVADSFTLAIGHLSRDTVVVDAVREISPPFNPDSTVGELAALLKSYQIHRVTGDRYAGEWPRAAFRAHGIDYRLNDAPASDLFRDLLPVINSGRIELPDFQPRLVAQLCQLERRTSRTGKDAIGHPPGGHDDIACAVAGLAKVLAKRQLSALQPARRRPSPICIPIFKR